MRRIRPLPAEPLPDELELPSPHSPILSPAAANVTEPIQVRAFLSDCAASRIALFAHRSSCVAHSSSCAAHSSSCVAQIPLKKPEDAGARDPSTFVPEVIALPTGPSGVNRLLSSSCLTLRSHDDSAPRLALLCSHSAALTLLLSLCCTARTLVCSHSAALLALCCSARTLLLCSHSGLVSRSCVNRHSEKTAPTRGRKHRKRFAAKVRAS